VGDDEDGVPLGDALHIILNYTLALAGPGEPDRQRRSPRADFAAAPIRSPTR
jgi:hypothetical protein